VVDVAEIGVEEENVVETEEGLSDIVEVVETAVEELDTVDDEGHKASVDLSEVAGIAVCYGVLVVGDFVGQTAFVDQIVVSPVSFRPSFLHQRALAEKPVAVVVAVGSLEVEFVVPAFVVANDTYDHSVVAALLAGYYRIVVVGLAFAIGKTVVVAGIVAVGIVVVGIVVVDIVVVDIVDVEGH
jgi:hypothetical protein